MGKFEGKEANREEIHEVIDSWIDDMGAMTEREIIEEYTDDKPCPSALILGFLFSFPYHVVVAECENHVRIITVYKPEEDKWIRYIIRRR